MRDNGVLIVGAGGVSRVVVYKCVQNINIFKKITLASRTLSKCEKIQNEVGKEYIDIAKVDADNVDEMVTLIKKVKPFMVLNIALPYQDLSIMEACLRTNVHYLDTANYEHRDTAKFEYKLQWAYDKKYKQKKIMALLGSGFDPGVTNVFCAYAAKHYFDEIHTIDILDCNGGDHGYAFATNFNPEINLREVSANGRYWEKDKNGKGKWIETKPLEIKQVWDYPEIGHKDSYLMYHEEMESLIKHIKGLKRIPLRLLKSLLPDPATLGERTFGKTNIGIVAEGLKDGKKRKIYIYNVCDHQKAFKESGAQAVSYTTGVPAMIGAKLMIEGKYQGDGVFNIEEFDPDPFMEELKKQGLPWHIKEL